MVTQISRSARAKADAIAIKNAKTVLDNMLVGRLECHTSIGIAKLSSSRKLFIQLDRACIYTVLWLPLRLRSDSVAIPTPIDVVPLFVS